MYEQIVATWAIHARIVTYLLAEVAPEAPATLSAARAAQLSDKANYGLFEWGVRQGKPGFCVPECLIGAWNREGL